MTNPQDERKPKIRKERPIEDTLLFKQAMDFREAIKGVLKNMNARHVPLYGTPMNDALRVALVNYRLCYLMSAGDDKVAYMRTACEKFAEVDIILNEWLAASIINKKTYCRLAPIVGGILDGSKRFYDAVRKRHGKLDPDESAGEVQKYDV